MSEQTGSVMRRRSGSKCGFGNDEHPRRLQGIRPWDDEGIDRDVVERPRRGSSTASRCVPYPLPAATRG